MTVRRHPLGMVPMLCAVLVFGALAADVRAEDSAAPPRPAPEEIALATARDGRDHREEAFAAILEMIRRDGAALVGAATVMPPPTEAMGDAEELRGRRFLVRGTLLQRSRLPRPWAHVEEWFIRHEDGSPFILFVVETDPHMLLTPVSTGTPIDAPARFYKRIDDLAQDGVRRSYAAFVTDAAFVRPVRVGDPALRRTGPLIALIVAMVPVLLLVRLLMRRVQLRRVAAATIEADGEEFAVEDLPDDPVEALRELRRRAEQGSEAEVRRHDDDR